MSEQASDTSSPHMSEVDRTFLKWILGWGVIAVICIGFLLVLSENERNAVPSISDTYGVKVIDYDTSLLGDDTMTIREGDQTLSCSVPTQDEIEQKAPLTECVVTEVIEAE